MIRFCCFTSSSLPAGRQAQTTKGFIFSSFYYTNIFVKIHLKMSNVKAQSSNKTLNPNGRMEFLH